MTAMAATRLTYGDARDGRLAGISVALGLHAAAVALLLSYAPAREALTSAVPLMVSLVTQVEAKPDTPPKPLPVKAVPTARLPQPQSVSPQPLLTTTAPAPSPVSIAPQPTEPAAVQTPASPLAPQASAAPPATSAAPAPAPVTPPSFNADYLNNPAPGYPAISRKLGEQGRVVFRVYVEPDGLPSDVRLQTSSGFERLDAVALAAIKRWKFVPARRGDAAVGGWVLVPLSFSLRS